MRQLSGVFGVVLLIAGVGVASSVHAENVVSVRRMDIPSASVASHGGATQESASFATHRTMEVPASTTAPLFSSTTKGSTAPDSLSAITSTGSLTKSQDSLSNRYFASWFGFGYNNYYSSYPGLYSYYNPYYSYPYSSYYGYSSYYPYSYPYYGYSSYYPYYGYGGYSSYYPSYGYSYPYYGLSSYSYPYYGYSSYYPYYGYSSYYPYYGYSSYYPYYYY